MDNLKDKVARYRNHLSFLHLLVRAVGQMDHRISLRQSRRSMAYLMMMSYRIKDACWKLFKIIMLFTLCWYFLISGNSTTIKQPEMGLSMS